MRTETDPKMAAVLDKLAAHSERLDDLQGRFDELAAALARHLAEDAGPEAWAPAWSGLTDKQYAAQLAALRAWVDGYLRDVYAPYTAGVILDCWASHPAAIHELGDLWAEHERIYHRAKPDPMAALTWKNRWLPGAMTRLPLVMGQACKDGKCPDSAVTEAVTDFRATLDTFDEQVLGGERHD